MRRNASEPLRWLVAAGIALFLSGSPQWTSASCPEGSKLPEEVKSALEENSSALDAFTIRWTRSRSSRLSLTALLSKINNEKELSFMLPQTDVYMRQDGMIYYSRPTYWYRPNSTEVASVGIDEFAFDGQKMATGNGAKGGVGHTPALIVHRCDYVAEAMRTQRIIVADYFSPAGFFCPEMRVDMRLPVKSIVLHLIDENADVTALRPVSVDGENLLLVELARNDGKSTFWLAPTHHYAVKRSEEFDSLGRLTRKVENGTFTRLPGTEAWLPWECVVHYYSYVTLPIVVFDDELFEDVFRVEEANKDLIPVAQFSLRYEEPGTYITDGTLRDDGVDVTYIVPANREDLERVVEAALEGRDYQPQSRGRTRYLMFGVSVVFLLATSLWIWWRRDTGCKDVGHAP